MNYRRQGISLIVLVITIIVIVILAGGVILTLSENNPINAANEAVFKSDLDAVESDLSLYLTSQYASTHSFNPDKLNANDLTAEYNDVEMPGKTIKDIIPVLSSTTKYDGQFEVVNGKLVYIGTDRTKKKWAQEVNIDVIDADRLDGIITTTTTLPVSAGTDVVATIKISSNASIDNINLTGNLELLDINNVLVPVQPVFEIAAPSGSETDTLRNVEVTIKTDSLAEGTYKLKLKAGAISNIYDVTNETDIVTDELFEIDNTPPANPEMSASPTGWTNGDVSVTITYPSDSVTKEYSTDGENWSTYTSPVTVTTNNTTVYARTADNAGNQSGQSTMTIANIDRELPTVAYGTNGGENLQVATTTVTVSDVGVSGVDITSLKYIWDTQNITDPTGEWTIFLNNETISKSNANGTYYLWVKALDNTGNSIVTKSNAFTVDNIVPGNPTMSASPTSWTNGNVTVTITYPADVTIKEYSTDATTWSTYISGVVVTTNNTTVYARGKDASGNQSGQSTITIANIDNTIPIVNLESTNVYLLKGDSYNLLAGFSSSDLESGIKNNSITLNDVEVTNTSSWNAGTYIVKYKAINNANSTSIILDKRIVIVEQTIYDYSYLANYHTFTVPADGNYKFELWGAAGGEIGTHPNTNGRGAYTTGKIALNEGTKIYIYVGEKGGSNYEAFNGGGFGEASGGGATDIRLIPGNWHNFDSLKSRIMVSAGGGSGVYAGQQYEGTQRGDGGTLNGIAANFGVYTPALWGYSGGGATQTSGGIPGKEGVTPIVSSMYGSFGGGGYCLTSGMPPASGGGGGYYGGGHGTHPGGSWPGGGGGSSFISGYAGCNAIAESSTATNIIHTNQANHYSNYVFSDTQMIAGNQIMPNASSGTMEGNTSYGYARITLLNVTN